MWGRGGAGPGPDPGAPRLREEELQPERDGGAVRGAGQQERGRVRQGKSP